MVLQSLEKSGAAPSRRRKLGRLQPAAENEKPQKFRPARQE
jgi:hypothetical protein